MLDADGYSELTCAPSRCRDKFQKETTVRHIEGWPALLRRFALQVGAVGMGATCCAEREAGRADHCVSPAHC